MTGLTETANLTVNQLIASLPELERAEIEATGTASDNINWYWGRKAEEFITRGLPKMTVYMAIARMVGRSATTVRNSYYTWKSFDAGDREEYFTAPWSVFNHARQCDDPDAVLEYQRTEAAGVDEIEAQFPITAKTDETYRQNVPAWAMPIYRRFEGLKEEVRDHAQTLLNELIGILEAA
jgi:hypothetical protein